jgi:predicted Abi (CAAX) family protease
MTTGSSCALIFILLPKRLGGIPFGVNLARMIKTCGTASSFFAVAASGLSTLPSRRDVGETLILFAVFALLAFYIGTGFELFKFSVTEDWTALALVAGIAFLVPALAEELVFRVLLGGRENSVRALCALGAFLVWHPVQTWLGLPLAQPIFTDPAFLLIVGLLGGICTISWQRSGSIWPAVVMHWILVVAWKGFTAPV